MTTHIGLNAQRGGDNHGNMTGYHSNCRVPEPGAVIGAELVYATLLDEARKFANWREDMTPSFARLNKASVRIVGVVKLKSEIAFKTNWLAFNATIEAAHATGTPVLGLPLWPASPVTIEKPPDRRNRQGDPHHQNITTSIDEHHALRP